MSNNNQNDFLKEIPDEDLQKEIGKLFTEKRLYTYLVGAGISMDAPSCVPSARMFVRELLNYYAPKEEIEKLSRLDSLRYEFLVEEIQNLFDKELVFLDYLDEVKEPNANHIFLVNMIMRYNYVITTNFDYLIELALKRKLGNFPVSHQYHKKVMAIITREDYNKNVQFQFPVIKIHGSKWDRFTGRSTKDSLITTISALGRDKETGKTFAIEPYKKKLINKIMDSRDLVVMGYSASDDFDISPMLRELIGLKRIIWIDHDQNCEKEKIYKFLPLSLKLLDDEFEFSKLDRLLNELASTGKVEVYMIKTNTINFVKNRLAPIYHEAFESLKNTEVKNVQNFGEYLKVKHLKASNSKKYRLAHELYFDLGDTSSAERTALNGLTNAKEEKNKILEVFFVNALGLLYLSKGELDKAIIQFKQALQINEEINQLNEQIGILLNIGEYYRKKSDFKNALKYNLDANDLINEKTPNILKFSILNSLGVVYKANGDVENAKNNFENALKIAESMGDLSRKALCYNNLASIYFLQGLLDPALKNSSEALKINELLGNLDDMASNYNTIGNIYRIAGYQEEALKNLLQAYLLASKTKNLRLKALAGNNIGAIYFQQGKFDRAMRNYDESYKIRRELEDLSGQATSLNNIGMIYRMKGDIQKAFEYFEKSILITEEIGEKTHLGLRYANRASIYEAKKEFEKALEEYKKAIQIERSQNKLHGVANQLNNMAGMLGDMGRHDECIQEYSKALSIMEDLKIKPGIAQTLGNLGAVYFKYKNNHEKAIPLLERAIQIYKDLNQFQKALPIQQNLDFIRQKSNKK